MAKRTVIMKTEDVRKELGMAPGHIDPASWNHEPSVFPPPKRRRWEYLVDRWDPQAFPLFQAFLNDRGASGWELVPLAGATVVFKREVI